MEDKNYDLSKGGVKFDQGKPEWTLLPLKGCLEGVVRVLMYGAKKYTPDNWRAGMPWRRVIDATFRHLNAWLEGEDLDPETKLNHIDHALCELLFVRYYITHNLGKDDRFPVTPTGSGEGILLKSNLPSHVACSVCGEKFINYASYVWHFAECQKRLIREN